MTTLALWEDGRFEHERRAAPPGEDGARSVARGTWRKRGDSLHLHVHSPDATLAAGDHLASVGQHGIALPSGVVLRRHHHGEAPPRIVRLRPPGRSACGEYELDAVSVRAAEDGFSTEVCLHLGRGTGIYEAAPAFPGGPMCLWLVDDAASVIDGGIVEEDFAFDLPRLEWKGELGALDEGRALVALAIESTVSPRRYRYELVSRTATGDEERTVLASRRT